MREKRIYSILLLILAISMVGIAFVPINEAKTSRTPAIPMDIGPKLRDPDFQVNFDPTMPDAASTTETTGTEGLTILDLKRGLWYDDTAGLYLDWYYVVAEGENAEVWVQTDLSYPDSRPTPVVTQEQVDYLLNEFDSNIYPTDTGYFGTENYHDGSNAPLAGMLGYPSDYYYSDTGKSIIMVSNIGDEMFWDPDYPYFVIGFYWGTYEYYFNRNIINIDADFWEGYTGLEGQPVYEGTIAHEYQHLLHDDYNPADETFMNEGCSMFAEYLCGYGVDWPKINSYLATPDNSLTVWSDHTGINTLADYGAAELWAHYLNDRFGPEFLGNFVQSGYPGIDGLNYWLYPYTFNEIYRDWRIANLLHTDAIGGGIYNYESLDLGEADPIYMNSGSLPTAQYGTDYGNTITILGYDTGVAQIASYGSDYVYIDNLDDFIENKLFDFDGDEGYYVDSWTDLGGGLWYSGDADLYNALLTGEAYVDPADPTLSFITYIDIEDYWDFGFVQVSTDGGATWTSLANEYTTDYHEGTHPDIVANLPGLTGWSGGYMPMSFDLSAYAGQDVFIGFRYMTDWYTTYYGWEVTEVTVSGNSIVDLTPVLSFETVDWQVTLVYYKERDDGKGMQPYKIKDVTLDELETGSRFTGDAPDEIVAIISPINGGTGFVDYWFSITDW